ncbi:MAG TPA: hypothetical protein VLZ12_08480 [Verrucomicrobiae bacterium]|nr:hypothetical protein [Verrucomicrobiae bacterium]
MNKHCKLFCIVSAVAVIAVTTGCNTVSVTSQQSIVAPTYPPTDPASVQILQTPPIGAHVRLGEVTAQLQGNPSREMIRTKLQTAAAAMGANAVVIVSDRQQVLGAYVTGPWWGRQVQTETARVIIGVAIHYIQ